MFASSVKTLVKCPPVPVPLKISQAIASEKVSANILCNSASNCTPDNFNVSLDTGIETANAEVVSVWFPNGLVVSAVIFPPSVTGAGRVRELPHTGITVEAFSP